MHGNYVTVHAHSTMTETSSAYIRKLKRLKLFAKNVDAGMLCIFNYNRKSANDYVRLQKRTKADVNVYCLFQPEKAIA